MKNRRFKGLSIKTAMALYSVIAISVLTIVISGIGYHLFEKNVKENYQKYARTVLDNAYSIVELYSFGDMIADRDMPADYEKMRGYLNSIKENSDIEYLYAIYFEDIEDIHSVTYAINTKTAEELENGGTYTYLGTPCEAGGFEDDTLLELQSAVKKGKKKSATLEGHSDEYGHMLNGYRVIFDSKGKAVGLLCVEIDINNISKVLKQYISAIMLFAFIITVVIIAVFVIKTEHAIIFPITGISDAAEDFVKSIGSQEDMDKSVNELIRLKIRSRNEIGVLYKTISKMETAIAEQLSNIRQKNKNIMRMQNGLMVLMADMVAVRDSDTGAHIQKTSAYVKIILEGLQRKGYYQDILTPQYINDVVKSAPLHDVGKIHIRDEILNKTSKLTDEEYEIMKTHTTFGKEIIDKAINTVDGEGYLLEARNMAAYHHERWDGTGYPEGLKGEEIPLSARVMAVADVLDALTSPRIYKPAFPLSVAIQKIEEGKEIQFDPKCVEALIDSLPEVKTVLKRFYPDYKDEGLSSEVDD